MSTAIEEINKQVVLRFYEAGLNQKDYATAANDIGDHYIQHNPMAKDGPMGFKAFLDFRRRENPKAHCKILSVIAEGDLVALHVHEILEPGDLGNAIVDIYRLENHKIVEHWDVIQPVPKESANANGMFGPIGPGAGRSE